MLDVHMLQGCGKIWCYAGTWTEILISRVHILYMDSCCGDDQEQDKAMMYLLYMAPVAVMAKSKTKPKCVDVGCARGVDARHAWPPKEQRRGNEAVRAVRCMLCMRCRMQLPHMACLG